MVKTADCVPVLLAGTDARVIAAIHCGWRSIAGGIVEHALSYIDSECGVRPSNTIIALGPSIGRCCYEIGSDVAACLRPESVHEVDGRLYGDLKAEVVSRFLTSGVNETRIHIDSSCTSCDAARFFSYRRDGVRTGRMAGFIMKR
jgi:YfiH family protein